MRVPQRLWAVLIFAALGLLALAFAGLLDWITSVLFLVLEFVAECFRPLFGRKKEPQHRGVTRGRGIAGSPTSGRDRPRRRLRRKVRPRREPMKPLADATPGSGNPRPRPRVLVPLSADRPELVAFALDECLGRHAELLVLFVRPLAVTPMGPTPLPTLAEDGPALALFEQVGERARDAGVPLRTFYRVTHDMPGTILDVARSHEADVLLMEATRRNLLWRALWGDEVQAVLMHLPQHVNLLIRTS